MDHPPSQQTPGGSMGPPLPRPAQDEIGGIRTNSAKLGDFPVHLGKRRMPSEFDCDLTLEESEDAMELGLDDEITLSEEESNEVDKNPQGTCPIKDGKRSEVWKYFETYFDDKGFECSQCKYCTKTYAATAGKHGTSNMHSHIKKCPGNPENMENTQTLDAFCSNASEGSRFSKEEARKVLAEFIAVEELPFVFVEKKCFRKFCRTLNPTFSVPSRSTMTRDILENYVDKKKTLISYFKKHKFRICLTTDTWTSNTQINFLCLTGHFLDEDWNLKKLILNFVECPGHKGDDIGRVIEKCLQEWGIDMISTITVDNATSNDTVVAYLVKRLIAWKKRFVASKIFAC